MHWGNSGVNSFFIRLLPFDFDIDLCFKACFSDTHTCMVVNCVGWAGSITIASNESIDLILVIQTFHPSVPSVLSNKDVYPTSSIVWSRRFLLLYLNHIRLYKTLSYHSHTLCFFTLLILWFIYIYIYIYIYVHCSVLCSFITSECLISLGRTHELCLCSDISIVRRMSEIALYKNNECILQPRLIKHELVLVFITILPITK